MERLINLHVHTNVSDGKMSPADVVRYAKESGLAAIAITDHDTVYGVMDALLWGYKEDIEIIPGIELSTQFMGEEVHLVGLFIDYTADWFIQKLRVYRKFRKQRGEKIVERFNLIGVDITMDDVLEEAGNANLGRPHIARILLKKGIVSNIQEAFDRFMIPGRPCYVPKFKLSTPTAIRYIHELKGLAFMAHPVYNRWWKIIPRLKMAGLDGIEAIHSSHSRELQHFFIDYARRLRLLISGGSDFHTPEDALTDMLSVRVSYAFLERMKQGLMEAKI